MNVIIILIRLVIEELILVIYCLIIDFSCLQWFTYKLKLLISDKESIHFWSCDVGNPSYSLVVWNIHNWMLKVSSNVFNWSHLVYVKRMLPGHSTWELIPNLRGVGEGGGADCRAYWLMQSHLYIIV